MEEEGGGGIDVSRWFMGNRYGGFTGSAGWVRLGAGVFGAEFGGCAA